MARDVITTTLPAQVGAELRGRARDGGVSPSHLCAVLLARAFGMDEPPRPNYRRAELAGPLVLRAVGEAGTVATTSAALGVGPEVARRWLDRGVKGGLLTQRRGRREGSGGSAPVTYRPTPLGRRVAEAADQQ